MSRVALSISIVLGVWALLFYYVIVDEIHDETDDVLEDYSASIIQNFLAGEIMPVNDNGSNNTYYLRPVRRDSLEYFKQRGGFVNEEIYIKYKRENEPARVLRQVFRDADDNYYEVTVITPTIDNNDLIEAIWRSLVVLFLLLLVTVLVINVVAVKGGLRPLHKFLAWLHNSNIETCEVLTVKNSNIKEINELNIAIEAFANRGRRAFKEQKEFLGNASHELQTPIAVCQGRLELLCESELTQQQMEDVGVCLDTLSRMSRLNKSLLMLSKIENGGFEKEEVVVNDLLHRNIEFLKDIYEVHNISLSVKELGTCSISANGTLIATMITNLIKNAYSHNVDGGEVRVVLGLDYITVENSGITEALDECKIFNRFYQGNTKSGTFGLGLPIVQSICKLYDFRIGYSYVSNFHRFEIKFK